MWLLTAIVLAVVYCFRGQLKVGMQARLGETRQTWCDTHNTVC